VSVVRKLLGKKLIKYLARARLTLVGRLVAPACALARCNNTNTNTRQDHKHNALPTRVHTSTTNIPQQQTNSKQQPSTDKMASDSKSDIKMDVHKQEGMAPVH
jgi:hypothetical protein